MRLYALSMVLALGFACASNPQPPPRMPAAQAAVGGAEHVGTLGDPQAALYLKLSQEQLTKARSLGQAGETERADRMLMRAEADANLALALARQSKERNEAQQALDQVRALRGQK